MCYKQNYASEEAEEGAEEAAASQNDRRGTAGLAPQTRPEPGRTGVSVGGETKYDFSLGARKKGSSSLPSPLIAVSGRARLCSPSKLVLLKGIDLSQHLPLKSFGDI